MPAFKASIYLIATTAVRSLNGLAVLKILAVSTGLAEFGQVTQVMGVIALCSMFAAGGIGNGLTRQLANSHDLAGRQRWYMAALKVYLAASGLLAFVLLVSSWSLAKWLIGDQSFTVVFVCLALGQALVGASSLAQSVATAQGDYPFILRVTGIASILGAGLVGVSAYIWGGIGCAIALVVNAAFPGLVSVVLKRKAVKKLASEANTPVPQTDLLLLIKYAGVPLIGAASLTLAQIANRNLMGQALGWDTVGIWQAVVRLSDVYMQFISVLLIGFVLPRLSMYASYRAMNKPFLQMVATLCGLFVVMALVIYPFRELLIRLLFASSFLPATELVLPQLLGDLFRVAAVSLSVAMMARAEPAASMAFEASQGILAFGLTVLFIDSHGQAAPVLAYVVTYAILFVALAVRYRVRITRECNL